ncbi:MAG TPA: RICIN domain-containing protein [Umezawaea sp.]|nr:RICIN domain-containing protein [Umezawaea sp.]
MNTPPPDEKNDTPAGGGRGNHGAVIYANIVKKIGFRDVNAPFGGTPDKSRRAGWIAMLGAALVAAVVTLIATLYVTNTGEQAQQQTSGTPVQQSTTSSESTSETPAFQGSQAPSAVPSPPLSQLPATTPPKRKRANTDPTYLLPESSDDFAVDHYAGDYPKKFQVVLWHKLAHDQNGGQWQPFWIHEFSTTYDGAFRIKNSASGLCITGEDDNNHLFARRCTEELNDPHQLWRTDDAGHLINAHSGQCLSVADTGAYKDGVEVEQSVCGSNSEQNWRFIPE